MKPVHLLCLFALLAATASPLAAQSVPPKPYTVKQFAEIREDMADALKSLKLDIEKASREHPLIDRSKPVVVATNSEDSRTKFNLQDQYLRNHGEYQMDELNVQIDKMMGRRDPMLGMLLARLDYANGVTVTRPETDAGEAPVVSKSRIAPGGVSIQIVIGLGVKGSEQSNYLELAKDVNATQDIGAIMTIRGNPEDQEAIEALKEKLLPLYKAQMSLLQRKIGRTLGK